MVERYFPQDEYDARWRRVRKLMTERGYELAVIWGRSGGTYERCGNVLYLTNFYSSESGQLPDSALKVACAISAVIMSHDGEPELIADEQPNPALIATERYDWAHDTIKATGQRLRDLKPKGKVALVGSDFFPMKYWEMLKSHAPDVKWAIDDELVGVARRIKSARELACFREGGKIVTRALNTLFERLIEGKRESDAAADAAAEVIRSGGAFHMIPISHGDSIEYFCRNPLTGYSLDKPKRGDIVRGWVYGPVWQGYWLDPGRTTVVGGKPNSGQRSLIENCAAIVEAVISEIKAGVKVIDAARLGDKMSKKFGNVADQAGQKWPLYGHGNGLFWEEPWISVSMLSDKDTVFEENMVLGVEAFLGNEGVGSAGFEQNVIVTKAGTELLTKTPMLFW